MLHLVGGQLRTRIAQHLGQHRPRGRVRVVRRMRLVMRVVRPVHGHVRQVGVAASGHGDVQILPGRRWRDQNMTGVNRHALRPMRRHGITQIQVVGGIGGGRETVPPRLYPARRTVTYPSPWVLTMVQRSPLRTQQVRPAYRWRLFSRVITTSPAEVRLPSPNAISRSGATCPARMRS